MEPLLRNRRGFCFSGAPSPHTPLARAQPGPPILPSGKALRTYRKSVAALVFGHGQWLLRAYSVEKLEKSDFDNFCQKHTQANTQ